MRRITLYPIIVTLACVLHPGPLHGAPQDDTDQLWEWLAAQERFAGQFRQVIYDEEGELLERSAGRYRVLRPSYFRWEIQEPDRQLLLVAGDALWHYDIDLATATRRNAEDDTAFAPLKLLGGDVATLRDRFSVEALGEGRYRLRPNWPQAGFASLVLGWQDEQLRSMVVADRSGQQLEIELDPELPAPVFSAADFAFEPPPGVDVFVEDPG